VAKHSRDTIDPELQLRELQRYDSLYERLMAEDNDPTGEPEAVRRGATSPD
jgi:hypothetical protein